MTRANWVNKAPQEWRNRLGKDICPVCAKEKFEFQEGMRFFCCPEHRELYRSKIIFWNTLKEEVIKEAKETCVKCKRNREKAKEEQKSKRKRAIDSYIKANKEKLKTIREHKLVELDRQFKLDYDRIMNDKNLIPWDEENKMPDEYDYKFYLEVDHIVPVALGGDMWDKKNLQALCERCHKKKTKKDMKEIRLSKKPK